MSESDLWTITTGADLNRRIRESGQTLEHDRERGYFLSQTHESVSPIAVAERRLGMERMREELGINKTDRLADLQQQQQQTRDWVGDMVERLKEIEREQPKERREERDEGRER